MKKIIITLFLLSSTILGLAGCAQSTWLYRVSVQQGNVITADEIKQLRQGMPKEIVSDILGPPVLCNTFNENRWTYIYTLKPTRGKYVQRKMVLHFAQGRLARIESNL